MARMASSNIDSFFKNDKLVFITTYDRSDLVSLVQLLNNLVLEAPKADLERCTIYQKYSHINFFEVSFQALKFNRNQDIVQVALNLEIVEINDRQDPIEIVHQNTTEIPKNNTDDIKIGINIE